MSSSTSERKRYHKDNAPTDDILTLINLVRQNPALYNYKLQPNQRRTAGITGFVFKLILTFLLTFV